MNHNAGVFSLSRAKGKQEALVTDGIFVLVVGLLALGLAAVVILTVIALANPNASLGIGASVEASLDLWNALDRFYAPDYEGSNGAGVTQVLSPDEATSAAWR